MIDGHLAGNSMEQSTSSPPSGDVGIWSEDVFTSPPPTSLAGVDISCFFNQDEQAPLLPPAAAATGPQTTAFRHPFHTNLFPGSPPKSDLSHACRRIPSTEFIDRCLDPSHVGSKRVVICMVPNCSAGPFNTENQARRHVQQHLGIRKLYQCVMCKKEFASLGTAKRHQETQIKAFPCMVCLKEYARKDYRNSHQKRCKKVKLGGC